MYIFLFIYWPFKRSTIQNNSVKSSDLCFAFIRFAFHRLQLRLKQQFAAFIEWLQLLLVCLLLILVLLLFPLLMLLLLMLLFLLGGGQFKARNWRWPCQIALVIVAVRLPVWLSARLSFCLSSRPSVCQRAFFFFLWVLWLFPLERENTNCKFQARINDISSLEFNLHCPYATVSTSSHSSFYGGGS